MATVETRFGCKLELYHDFTCTPLFSQTGFHLQIRKFLKHQDGSLQEDEAARFEDKQLQAEFVFGSDRHCSRVAHLLREEAGWSDQPSLETILDAAFSRAKSTLEKDKIKRGFFSNKIPIIKFCVDKFVSCEDELEAMALQLSMQEVPTPIPATKDSIQTLKKVKVEGDIITQDCMICMEQLSYGTEDDVISMPCAHLFHEVCIKQWLNTSHTCPLCRFRMPTDC